MSRLVFPFQEIKSMRNPSPSNPLDFHPYLTPDIYVPVLPESGRFSGGLEIFKMSPKTEQHCRELILFRCSNNGPISGPDSLPKLDSKNFLIRIWDKRRGDEQQKSFSICWKKAVVMGFSGFFNGGLNGAVPPTTTCAHEGIQEIG